MPDQHRRLPYLPWEPLARVLAVFEVERQGVGTSTQYIAQLLDMNGRRISTFQRAGRLTIEAAERICDRIGVHPAEVWSEYGAVAEDMARQQDERNATRLARDAARHRVKRNTRQTKGANA